MSGTGGGRIRPGRLAERLKVLASENRIQLLRQLQLPHALSEIELPPSRQSRSLDPDRSLAKQTVAHHLEVLAEHGFVRSRGALRDGREVVEYEVNHAELFLVVEELRSLMLIRTARGRPDDKTAGGPTPDADDDTLHVHLPDGPALVLMTGPLLGTPFPLAGAGPWTVGRAAACAVSLRHDPFVSAEHAAVEARNGRRALVASPAARNGTTVNWARVEPGAARALAPGDVVGVGRSLLVYREGPGR